MALMHGLLMMLIVAKELSPSTAESRDGIEQRRKVFLTQMGKIQSKKVIGIDKNIYVEPATWAVDHARETMYNYQ